MTPLRALCVCLGLFGGLAQAPAHAQPTPAEEDEAQACYTRGQRQYDLGNYASAIEEFKRGYLLSGLSPFLLNIAQAYRKNGDNENALLYYKRFMEKSEPDDPARPATQKIIDELERASAPVPPAPASIPAETLQAQLGSKYEAYLASGLTLQGFIERGQGERIVRVGYILGAAGVVGGVGLITLTLLSESSDNTTGLVYGGLVAASGFVYGASYIKRGRTIIFDANGKRRPPGVLAFTANGAVLSF